MAIGKDDLPLETIEAEAIKLVAFAETPSISFEYLSVGQQVWRFFRWIFRLISRPKSLVVADKGTRKFAVLSGDGLRIGRWMIPWDDFIDIKIVDGPIDYTGTRTEFLTLKAKAAVRHEKGDFFAKELELIQENGEFYAKFPYLFSLNLPPESLVVMAYTFQRAHEIRKSRS